MGPALEDLRGDVRMIRKPIIWMAILGIATVVTPPDVCQAQLLGAMATASVEEVGAQKIGGYVGVTGDYVSLSAVYRLGVASSFDFGFKAAFVDFSSPTGSSIAMNVDAKIQVLDVFLHDPVDVSIGPEVTFFKNQNITNWYLGGFISVSKEFALSNGKPLTPYGRVGLRTHRFESGLVSGDKFDTGLIGGMSYGVSGYTTLYGEIVLEDSGTGLHVGFQYQLP
jgi:hypothetical protein